MGAGEAKDGQSGVGMMIDGVLYSVQHATYNTVQVSVSDARWPFTHSHVGAFADAGNAGGGSKVLKRALLSIAAALSPRRPSFRFDMAVRLRAITLSRLPWTDEMITSSFAVARREDPDPPPSIGEGCN